ncbi:MAG: hypothetical protein ACRDKE_09455, partial [Solirubrobacterales bacterium]
DASFEFAAEDPTATFECRLDAGTWSACISPASYTELEPESSHKFLVRAVKDDKTQLLPSSFNWRITERPFDLYFITAPAWWGSSNDAEFALDADDADIEDLSIECSLDGAEFAACSTSESLFGLSEGAHSFTYRASKDGASEDVTYNWTISDALMSRFTSKPNAISDNLTAYFQWQTAGDVTGVDCKLDAGDWEACNPGGDAELDLLPGDHTFSIRAHDNDEGFQTPITSWTWNIDKKYPTISHDIPQVLTSMPFTATFTADEPLEYLRCSIDEGNSHDCSEGLTLDGLDDGWHEVGYNAEDLAGNETDDSYEFYVDSGASVATITSKPPWSTKSRAAKFEFTGEAGATFECRLNGDGFEPCTSPVTYDLLGFDEAYTFEVQATKNGRTQAEPTAYRWTITDHPFSLYFDNTPSKLSTDTTPYFEVDADGYDEDLLDFSCTLDDGAPFTCAEYFTLADLSLGEHTLTLVGSAQGVTEEISYEWRIHDDSAMIVAIQQTPSKYSDSTNANFYWLSAGSIDHVQCRLDEGAWGACDGNDYEDLEGLSDGEHTFEVRPLDGADVPGISDSHTWTVDTTAPVVDKSAVPASFSLPYQLPLSASEEIKSTECALDGEYRGNCGWPLKLTYLPLGAHTLEFFAFDLAGNQSDGLITIEFSVVAPTAPTGETPPTVTPPALPVKPVLTFKKPQSKANKFTLTVTCPIAKCTVSGWVKVGKKKYKLKNKSANSGKSTVTLKFDKKLAKATKKAKKGKSSFSLSVSGGGATTTKTGKF